MICYHNLLSWFVIIILCIFQPYLHHILPIIFIPIPIIYSNTVCVPSALLIFRYPYCRHFLSCPSSVPPSLICLYYSLVSHIEVFVGIGIQWIIVNVSHVLKIFININPRSYVTHVIVFTILVVSILISL